MTWSTLNCSFPGKNCVFSPPHYKPVCRQGWVRFLWDTGENVLWNYTTRGIWEAGQSRLLHRRRTNWKTVCTQACSLGQKVNFQQHIKLKKEARTQERKQACGGNGRKTLPKHMERQHIYQTYHNGIYLTFFLKNGCLVTAHTQPQLLLSRS